MLATGRWIGEKLECPYCKKAVKPRVISDPVAKECSYCHRYFLLPLGADKKKK